MGRVQRLLLVTVAVATAVGGCGDEQDSADSRPSRAAAEVAVASPVEPEDRSEPRPGTLELRAPGAGQRGGARWAVIVLTQPPDRPRDACTAAVLAQTDPLEANLHCDVVSPDAIANFLEVPAVPNRYGPAPTVLTGVAGPSVRSVSVDGPGGVHRLPLSAHRAFMAVYSNTARGRVRLIWRTAQRRATRTFRLPLSKRLRESPQHRHRRRGAVFDDEVGEDITALTRRHVVRRFGPPAAVDMRDGLTCTYYEVVGNPEDGWRFCFSADGRMASASGNSPPPGR